MTSSTNFRVICDEKYKDKRPIIIGRNTIMTLPINVQVEKTTMDTLVELSADEYDKLYKLILMMSSSLLPRLSEKAKSHTTLIPSDEDHNSGHLISYYQYYHVVEIFDYSSGILLTDDRCEKYNKDLADAIERYLSMVYEYVRELNAQKVIERIKFAKKK